LIEGPFSSEEDAEKHAFEFNEIIAKYSNFYRRLKDLEANVLSDIEKLNQSNINNPVPETDSAEALATLNRVKLIETYETFLVTVRTQIDELDKLDSMSFV
jgi:hypothetical protein